MYARIKETLIWMFFGRTGAKAKPFLGNVTEDRDIPHVAPHVRFLRRRGDLGLSLDHDQAPFSDLPAEFVGARLRRCRVDSTLPDVRRRFFPGRDLRSVKELSVSHPALTTRCIYLSVYRTAHSKKAR